MAARIEELQTSTPDSLSVIPSLRDRILESENPYAIVRDAMLQDYFHSQEEPKINDEGLYIDSPLGEKRAELVDFLVSLPDDHGHSIWKTSENLTYISDNEASSRALDRVYLGTQPESDFNGYLWSTLMLDNLHNALAVRNRFAIVQNVFEREISEHTANNTDTMNVVSIAAGSSRALMETAAELPEDIRSNMNIRMTDLSKDALGDGLNLAQDLGITDITNFRRSHYRAYERYLEDGYQPNFVEIVGLLDYLTDEQITGLLSKVHEKLTDGGSVIYSNVSENDEQPFLHNVIGWRPMIYREADRLASLAQSAGFDTENIELIREPLGYCNLIVAKK